ncbi:UbiX family flavin prenyltransferase [Methylocella sp.]|uniref:UbiX family flavin prenyltransferase n=1 Tax=Methylocella sp. TaxID=1978226 RepID=UPI0037837579
MQQHVTPPPRRRMIVGISGATGNIYGLRLLEVLRRLDIETHLVMTKPGERTLAYETDLKVRDVRAMADFSYNDADIGAAIASGSFRTMGMVVAPCSVRSLAAIAAGNTDGLLTRAADVCLNERRRVVLMFRETPLHAGHIRAMAQATENGAIVFPPVPAWLVVTVPRDWRRKSRTGETADLCRRIGQGVFASKAGLVIPKVIVLDDDVDPTDVKELVWAFATRCHPLLGHAVFNDIEGAPLLAYLLKSEKVSGHTGKIVYNCLAPDEWGEALPMRASFRHGYPAEIVDRVRRRWNEYGVS